jgi:hypothetical protein
MLIGGWVLAADPSEDLFDLENLTVKIGPELPYLEVLHKGKKVLVMRHQDPANRIIERYAVTSRDCPPNCVQPISLHPGVETIGELEVLDYLKRIANGDHSVLVIDSRTKDWLQDTGTIPGAIHISYKRLDLDYATTEQVAELMEFEFDAIRREELWNFDNAKTLVFFCNGPWCGQSPTNIRALLTAGYPPE